MSYLSLFLGTPSQAFLEFMELLGDTVELVGGQGYAGGLPVTAAAPGMKGKSFYTSTYSLALSLYTHAHTHSMHIHRFELVGSRSVL